MKIFQPPPGYSQKNAPMPTFAGWGGKRGRRQKPEQERDDEPFLSAYQFDPKPSDAKPGKRQAAGSSRPPSQEGGDAYARALRGLQEQVEQLKEEFEFGTSGMSPREIRRQEVMESLRFLKQRLESDPAMAETARLFEEFRTRETREEAKVVFRKLIRNLHPDMPKAPPDATEIMSHLNRLKPNSK